MKSEENLLIDPLYPSLEEYNKDFDYDLLGQSVKLSTRFFADPRTHIEWWVHEQHAEIIIVGTALMLGLLILLFIKFYVLGWIANAISSIKYAFILRGVKWRYLRKKETKSDEFVANVYRKIVANRKLLKYAGKTNLPEYEGGRFNWEAIRNTGFAYDELVRNEEYIRECCQLQGKVPCCYQDLTRSEMKEFFLEQCLCEKVEDNKN
ncbi:unnamed protein product [Rodentolepis nana]|uniref:YcxB domain-containing protein n=1 Tax=Rodentolepis nana TaxID=102285 RepID=A0A0R3T650_RODNA|nr:unnamed protein product [Rodentolepis nana]